jgi:hypothetical protein
MSTLPVSTHTEFAVVYPTPASPGKIVPPGGAELEDRHVANPVSVALPQRVHTPKNWLDRMEAFISALSVRDNFWHRICSFIWLPYAYFSGIRMKQVDEMTYQAILPFSRFNRNWYRAMAGAALLGNSEIAGGMYVFGVCGANYTVVCKHLTYKFLRPCLGPAIYKMKPREDVHALMASGDEFNLTLDMEILQQVYKLGEKDRRVGKCEVVFHVTPRSQHQANYRRLEEKSR